MGNGQSATSKRRPVRRVAVLGGGVCGLTAAYTLLREDDAVHVDIYEASGSPGGAILSKRDGGFTFELGANSMNSKYSIVDDFIRRQLGLGDRITPRAAASRRFLVLKNGALQPVPMSPAQLLKSPLLSLPAKMRLLLEPFIPRRDASDAESESVGHFFARRFGKEVTSWLIDPAVAGIYSADPYQLSVKHAFKKVWQVEQQYGSILNGLRRGAFKTKPSSSPTMNNKNNNINNNAPLPDPSATEPSASSTKTSVAHKAGNNKAPFAIAPANASSPDSDALVPKNMPAPPQVSRAQLMQGFSYDDGMHVLTDTLVARIKEFGPRAKFHLGTPVHSLDSLNPSSYSSSSSPYAGSSSSSSSSGRAVVRLPAQGGGQWKVNGRRSRRYRYDAVVSTIPAHALRAVTSNVRTVRRGFRKLASTIPYAPVSIVVLGFDKSQMDPSVYGYGALVPSHEKQAKSTGLLGVNFTSDGFPNRLDDKSKTFWTVYLGGARHPTVTQLEPQQIVALATKSLYQSFGVSGPPKFAAVKNWHQGIPTYHPAYDQVLCTIARIERKTRGSIALAGNYRDGVGVPDAVLSGIRHAMKVRQYLQQL